MFNKPRPVLIGAFVTGAVLLLIGGLIFFGSGFLFSSRQTFVLFFSSSLKGLDVGSPVTFRGVPIGEVKKIKIVVDPNTGKFTMPVYISINPKSIFSYSSTGIMSELTHEEMAEILVKRGLKAQLQIQSLVTGKLQVDLDFYPDDPIRYVGLDKEHVEIPTVPSTVENIVRRFQEIPFDQLVKRLISAIDGIDKLIKSGQLTLTIKALHDSITELQREIKTIVPIVRDTLESIQTASRSTQAFVGHADQQLGEVATEVKRLSESANRLVSNADRVIRQLENVTGPDSMERYRLRKMLKEITNTARSLRILSDSIEAQPDIMISGRLGVH